MKCDEIFAALAMLEKERKFSGSFIHHINKIIKCSTYMFCNCIGNFVS